MSDGYYINCGSLDGRAGSRIVVVKDHDEIVCRAASGETAILSARAGDVVVFWPRRWFRRGRWFIVPREQSQAPELLVYLSQLVSQSPA